MYRSISAIVTGFASYALFACEPRRAWAGDIPDCELTSSATIAGPGVSAGDWYGCSLASDGTRLIVGAQQDDAGGDESGSATVFVRAGDYWQYEGTLVVPNSASNDRAGLSVAIHGSLAVLGAPFARVDGVETGAVYLFERQGQTWVFVQRVVAHDRAQFDRFGYSLGVEAGTIYVGSLFGKTGTIPSGCVYVLRNVGGIWTTMDRIAPPDPEPSARFGQSLALSEDHLIVGSPFHDANATNAGAAYVFARHNGSFEYLQHLVPPSPSTSGDFYGGAVAVNGEFAVVGASTRTVAAVSSGSAYVFREVNGVWQFDSELLPGDRQNHDFVGFSLSVIDQVVLVAATRDDDRGTDAGAVYAFRYLNGTWLQVEKAFASNASSQGWFGYAIAVGGTNSVVSALFGNSGASNSGAVYELSLSSGCFAFSPADMNCDGVVTVGDIGGFVLSLTDPAGYAAQYPACDINNADVNNDGFVTVSDIGPFVALLTGG